MVSGTTDDWKTNFSKEFMMDIVFFNQIEKRVSDIFQHLPTSKDFPLNTPIDMKFQVIKRPETDYPEVSLSIEAMFFISAMAKAISDVMLREIIPRMSPDTKICKSCHCRINKVMNYCFSCGGSEFESS